MANTKLEIDERIQTAPWMALDRREFIRATTQGADRIFLMTGINKQPVSHDGKSLEPLQAHGSTRRPRSGGCGHLSTKRWDQRRSW